MNMSKIYFKWSYMRTYIHPLSAKLTCNEQHFRNVTADNQDCRGMYRCTSPIKSSGRVFHLKTNISVKETSGYAPTGSNMICTI